MVTIQAFSFQTLMAGYQDSQKWAQVAAIPKHFVTENKTQRYMQ